LKALYESPDGSKPAVSAQKTQTAGSKTEPSKTVPRATGQQQSSGNSKVEIITFEPTNSLVILAPADYTGRLKRPSRKLTVIQGRS